MTRFKHIHKDDFPYLMLSRKYANYIFLVEDKTRGDCLGQLSVFQQSLNKCQYIDTHKYYYFNTYPLLGNDVLIPYDLELYNSWSSFLYDSLNELEKIKLIGNQTKMLTNHDSSWIMVGENDFGLAVIGYDDIYKPAFEQLRKISCENEKFGWKNIDGYLKYFKEFADSSGISVVLWNQHNSNFRNLFD
jgi:hypothetical protein